ncbi:hypothetical protein Vadar_023229 [Vaccinium darrowii]|uniref:Uncharacterized protein n=1 Tax=Vaccinium darrowii TaxID=229202 RepID=A0ACB7YYN7_9ERIC|nr:hypothetical protein Vadar_023229 [Vaccinium darrowii]
MEYPRTRGFDTEGVRKWRKSRVPTQHGGYICFRTLSPASNSVTDFYSIPLYFANNGAGGPVYLKPFYRSGMIPLSSTFVAAGSSSLFCLGGTEEKQHTLKPIKRIYRFDTRDPNRGWYVHDFHMLSRRDCHATIAMDGKVFVLGGLECSDDSRAKFFDPIWDSSLPLPQQLPSPLPSNSDKFATAALTDSKRILVASCISEEAHVYHVMTEEWEEWDQKVNFFPKNPVRGEAAVLRNTTLCWFQEHDHVLHAYDMDLKMWLECPIRGLDEVGLQMPGQFLWCSLFSLYCDCLCLLWMDNSYYSNTKLPALTAPKLMLPSRRMPGGRICLTPLLFPPDLMCLKKMQVSSMPWLCEY